MNPPPTPISGLPAPTAGSPGGPVPPTVHLVLPNDIDDPARPSGGNVYDRRLIDGLRDRGWAVQEHPVAGSWPDPARADRTGLDRVLAALPDGALVVVDGLVASPAPEVLVPHAGRLSVVVLVHMPLGARDPSVRATEAAALRSAAAVVTTSRWSRRLLLSLYDLAEGRVHVATPGVDPAPLGPGSPAGGRLLCVAAVTRHKGHDVLVRALAQIPHLAWTCVCVGALDREPSFVDELRRWVGDRGLGSRVAFLGPRAGNALRDRYTRADLLVLASRGESYGMVVTEALSRGVPVVATASQGLPEAMGRVEEAVRPGILVPPDDASALADALRGWLTDAALRERLRAAAGRRRASLPSWPATVDAVASVLARVHVHSGAIA